MNINTETVTTKGTRISLVENNQEVARTYLKLMHNDLYPEPLDYYEDVYS